MALQFQNLDIPFGPLDTKTDPAMLPHGALTLAENASSQTNGIYRKRYGYAALGSTTITGTPVAGSDRLAARGSELLTVDDAELYSYASLLSAWVDHGRLAQPVPRRYPVQRSQTEDASGPSVAYCNGVHVVSWVGYNATSNVRTFRVRALDANGSELAAYDVAAPAGNVLGPTRAVKVGYNVVVFWGDATAGNLYATKILTTNVGAGFDSPPATLSNGYNGLLDACEYSDTHYIVAFKTAITNKVIVRKDKASDYSTTAFNQTASSPEACIAVHATAGEGVWAVWSENGSHDLVGMGLDPDLMLGVGEFTLLSSFAAQSIAIGRNAADAVDIFADPGAGLASATRRSYLKMDGTRGIRGSIYDCRLASKPFVVGGRKFITFRSDRTEGDPVFFVADYTTQTHTNYPVPVAHFARLYAGSGAVADAALASSTAVDLVVPVLYKLESQTVPRTALDRVRLDFAPRSAWLTQEALGDTFFAGGLGTTYDGGVPTDLGFLQAPSADLFDASAVTSGGSIADGTYYYSCVYEKTTRGGNVYTSARLAPYERVVTGGSGAAKVELRIPTSTVEAGSPDVLIGIYRTTSSNSTNLYRSGHVANDRTADSVTFTDVANDSVIVGHNQQYVGLDREPPPPHTISAIHNGRLWVVSSEDQKTVWYSGTLIPGEGPWFSNVQTFNIDAGGDITGLASLDSHLLVFKADRIFVVDGDGVNALGTNSSLQTPVVLPADCGCVEPRSVITIPTGCFFLSGKGIYLVDRSLSVRYIGAAVAGYTDSYQECAAAVMLPAVREVRFSMRNPASPLETPLAVDLVYNYDADRWTTHLKAGDADAKSAALVGGCYYWSDTNGGVYGETAGAFTDPGSRNISMTLETGWIRPAGLQGLARVQQVLFLGEFKAPHSFECQVARDYERTYDQTFVKGPSTLGALATQQLAYHLSAQQGEAFRVRVSDLSSDAEPSSPGEGYTARGLTMTVGIKRGTIANYRPKAAKG